jgi:hypothetical protein
MLQFQIAGLMMVLRLMLRLQLLNTIIARNARKTLKDPVLVEVVRVVILDVYSHYRHKTCCLQKIHHCCTNYM